MTVIYVRKPSPLPALAVTGIVIASTKLRLQFFVYYQFSLLVSFASLFSNLKKKKQKPSNSSLICSKKLNTKKCHHPAPAIPLNQGWWQMLPKLHENFRKPSVLFLLWLARLNLKILYSIPCVLEL